MTNKVWTSEDIIKLLESNPKAIDRAVIQLFNNQNAVGVDGDEYHILEHFSSYIQGLDSQGRKAWVPKSLSNPHSKIFISQKIITKPAIEVGKEIALKYIDSLVKIANGEKLFPQHIFLWMGGTNWGDYMRGRRITAYRKDLNISPITIGGPDKIPVSELNLHGQWNLPSNVSETELFEQYDIFLVDTRTN